MGIYANSCGFTPSFPVSVTFKLGEDMGNSLSLIMLAAWPAVAAMLFSRLTPRQALIWGPLLGYLLLPPVVGIDLLVRSPREPDYAFIEANERPGLANHEPQPTAARFVDLLFPETRKR